MMRAVRMDDGADARWSYENRHDLGPVQGCP